jgi:hypothetical protein
MGERQRAKVSNLCGGAVSCLSLRQSRYCEGVGSSTTTTRQRGKGGVYRTMYGKLPAGESQARRARPALRRRKMKRKKKKKECLLFLVTE